MRNPALSWFFALCCVAGVVGFVALAEGGVGGGPKSKAKIVKFCRCRGKNCNLPGKCRCTTGTCDCKSQNCGCCP